MRTQRARVLAIVKQGPDIQELRVDGASGYPALCYPQFTGACQVGDEVLLNTTATYLGLGTGGYDLVIARLEERCAEAEQPAKARPLPPAFEGHILKLRYTPLQCDVPCIEDPASPFHQVMAGATSLEGMPVVCCGLHSQVVPVAAGIRHALPDAKIVYCMLDEGALMLQFSHAMRAARDTGLINLAITCGQATGGDAEAVSLHSALLAAHAVFDADVAIAGIGPGIVGSGTPYGNGGTALAEAVNAAGALGGRVTAALRVSFADARERHRGVSHHALRALGTLALAPASVCLPAALPNDERTLIETQLETSGVLNRHTLIYIDENDVTPDDARGVALRSMGRGFDEDPWFFRIAWSAGVHAAFDARAFRSEGGAGA